MAINFPSSPVLNQTFTDSTSGFTFQWNGSAWKSFSAQTAAAGQIRALDDISGSFNGVTTSFALTSNSVSITPSSSAALVINLGGVIQDSTDDYSVSASNIIFSTPPTNGLTFSGISLGYVLPNTIISIADNATTDGRLNVAGILSATGLKVSGVSTLGNTIVGGATTQLIVNGDARITGILTIGTSSLTLDGVNNQINIGSGVTIKESGAASFNQDLNVVGVVTATTFSGALIGNVTGTATTATLATNALGLTGIPNITVGTVTGNLTGNVTGNATGLSGTPNITVGTVTGNLTGNVTGNATGLSGTPNITVGIITASSVSISGNVSIGGTLTYEDVTNVDSLGVVTARTGIQVLANGINAVGIITATTLSSTNGTITNLTGTAGTITNLNVASTLNAVVGIITNVSGTNLNYTGVSTLTTLSSTNGTITNLTGTAGTITNLNVASTLNAVVGVITNATGTNLNYTGVSTLTNATGTNLNFSGIVTASGGFNIGIQSGGLNVTTGVVTSINFVGSGNSISYNSGTKTVNVSISGGGGGKFSPVNFIFN